MASLPESSTFDAGVYQLELSDPVIGGPSGVSNTPLKNLANRTKYLKDHVDALEASRAPIASPEFTGIPKAPTAAAGTSTTQLASTAFVQAAVSASGFPSGTRLVFPQAAAPTGWTQVADDSADNRMLRVVKTAGAGVGGSHSPILNNVVPSHTHGFTTGGQSADHSHNGWTGGQNANHAHDYVTPLRSTDIDRGSGNPSTWSIDDTGGYWTGIQNNDHSHFITTGGASSNHTHSGSTDNGSSQTNWTPRYIDLILCAKN